MHLFELAARVEQLSIDQLLELAVRLVQKGRLEVAEAVAQRAADLLRLQRASRAL